MHHLWSVFSPVIFAAIGKQFLQVWAYMRSLQWLPSVKNRPGALCKQLCKQIGGWGTETNNQLNRAQRSELDINRKRRSAVPSKPLISEPRVSTLRHICYCNLDPRPAWNNKILRQITPLLSRLQSDDIFAQGGKSIAGTKPFLQHRAKKGKWGNTVFMISGRCN